MYIEAVVAPACFWLLLSADIMSREENGTLKSGSEEGGTTSHPARELREAGPRQSGRSPETGSGHLVTGSRKRQIMRVFRSDAIISMQSLCDSD